MIEKRSHIGGNVYTQLKENINVHKYVHISSTLTTKKIGSTLTNLQTSTDTLIHLLPLQRRIIQLTI